MRAGGDQIALTPQLHTAPVNTRRALLLLPVLARLAVPARAGDPVEEASIRLGGVRVPADRARLVATVPLGPSQAALVAFAADLPEGLRELVVVTDGTRVLALELLAWRGEDGSRLQTRLSAVTDRQRLRLERGAAAPRGRGIRREDWTDYLRWQPEGPMLDAPVRPVLAGTWQEGLAAQRANMRVMLLPGLHGVPPGLIAACPPPRFPV